VAPVAGRAAEREDNLLVQQAAKHSGVQLSGGRSSTLMTLPETSRKKGLTMEAKSLDSAPLRDEKPLKNGLNVSTFEN
jgi:hypothetical protein